MKDVTWLGFTDEMTKIGWSIPKISFSAVNQAFTTYNRIKSASNRVIDMEDSRDRRIHKARISRAWRSIKRGFKTLGA